MHLSSEHLIDAAEGRLPPSAQAHVATCERCAADIARFTRLIALMRSDTSEAPPAAAAGRVRGLFRAAPRRATQAQRPATLRFDSARSPQPVGLRASASASERQILFEAEPYLIDLRLARNGFDWLVAGQVLGPEVSGEVELSSPAGLASSPLSDISEFALPPVPPGSYTLTLRLGEGDLILADLML